MAEVLGRLCGDGRCQHWGAPGVGVCILHGELSEGHRDLQLLGHLSDLPQTFLSSPVCGTEMSQCLCLVLSESIKFKKFSRKK